MYSKNDLKRVLKKNFNSEFGIIKFYLNNISKLNYSGNKAKINKLVLESVNHAEMIIKKIIAIDGIVKGRLDKNVQKKSLREEVGLGEIYRYELNRTKDPEARKLLNWLIKEEKRHEKTVRALK